MAVDANPVDRRDRAILFVLIGAANSAASRANRSWMTGMNWALSLSRSPRVRRSSSGASMSQTSCVASIETMVQTNVRQVKVFGLLIGPCFTTSFSPTAHRRRGVLAGSGRPTNTVFTVGNPTDQLHQTSPSATRPDHKAWSQISPDPQNLVRTAPEADIIHGSPPPVPAHVLPRRQQQPVCHGGSEPSASTLAPAALPWSSPNLTTPVAP